MPSWLSHGGRRGVTETCPHTQHPHPHRSPHTPTPPHTHTLPHDTHTHAHTHTQTHTHTHTPTHTHTHPPTHTPTPTPPHTPTPTPTPVPLPPPHTHTVQAGNGRVEGESAERDLGVGDSFHRQRGPTCPLEPGGARSSHGGPGRHGLLHGSAVLGGAVLQYLHGCLHRGRRGSTCPPSSAAFSSSVSQRPCALIDVYKLAPDATVLWHRTARVEHWRLPTNEEPA